MSSSNLLSLNSTRRSLSPSRTPPGSTSRPSSATPSDDSSIITELSFDYTLDADGNPVRLNKTATSKFSNSSSPPTPHDSPENPQPREISPPPPSSPPQSQQPTKKPPSPTLLNPPAAPSSLSRSDSAYAVLSGTTAVAHSSTSASSARSFKRVASVSSLSVTPGGPSSSLSTGVRARRVAIEEHKEQEARNRLHIEEIRARMDADMRAQEEKENLIGPDSRPDDRPLGLVAVGKQGKQGSPPLQSRPVPTSQRASSALPTRAGMYGGSNAIQPLSEVPLPQRDHHGRVIKNVKFGSTGFDRIAEAQVAEGETGGEYHTGEDTDTGGEDFVPITNIPTNNTARQRSYAGFSSSLTGNPRPRRSASFSDASAQEDRAVPIESGLPAAPQQYMRPGSSLARRVAIEEKERQDLEVKQGYKRYLRETEEANRRSKAQADAHVYLEAQAKRDQKRPSLSPPPGTHAKPPYTHKRRDSDTLRNAAPSLDSPPPPEPLPPRLSPSARYVQPNASTSTSARHRRSPTAPEAPMRTWAGGESGMDEYGMGYERERPVSSRGMPFHHQPISAQQHISHQHQQHSTPALEASGGETKGRSMIVNKKHYARLDIIGKGGSSRVYRVLSQANELYAIKRVSLDKTDAETMCGYMNEIALLKRLAGNSRIIRLIDSEVRAGPGGTKGHLLLVMECGEIDLARLLQEQQKEPMNMVWVSYYWQQMLQAVHIIHEEKIVHSDLKPANFVLVRGHLKLIDFGIANAIANDTTNIQRDHQIGTVNYMSPEAIELPEGMRRLKVGRPSDVWSLGCILYQMVYGQPPFQHLSMYQKMKAIPDLTHVIDFPEFSTPSIPAARSSPQGGSTPPKKLGHLKRRVRRDVIASMKSCLARNPKERATIPELLDHDWLAMKEPDPPPAMKELLGAEETVINPHYMRQLLEYGIRLGRSSQSSDLDPEQLLRDARRLVAELKQLEP